MLARLSNFVIERPWRCVLVWGALLITAGLWAALHAPIRQPQGDGDLPADQPVVRAQKLGRRAFPQTESLADAVLAFTRGGGMTAADMANLERIGGDLRALGLQERVPGWNVRSPGSEPFLRSRLVASDATGRERAAMVVVSYDYQYDSDESAELVDKIEQTARKSLSADGLRMEVTGSGGLGRDEADAGELAHQRVTICAVLAVLGVLLVVYRAPLAASVPLISVAASAVVATQTLQFLRSRGVPITSDELTYLVVIVFGSGTDFALFWLSRFDEELERNDTPKMLHTPDAPHPDPSDSSDPSNPSRGIRMRSTRRVGAAKRAYAATMPGILSSAGTTITGMGALVVSLFQPTHVLGPAMAFALFVSLIAALTLMPALALLMGRGLFWPRRTPMHGGASAKRWKRLALFVTRRPCAAMLAVALLVAWPLITSFRAQYRLETDTGTLPTAQFLRGKQLVEQHFSSAVLFPWTCYVQFANTSPQSASQLADLSSEIGAAIRSTGAADVWSYDHPLGRGVPTPLPMLRMLNPGLLANYWNPAERSLRFEIMNGDPPFSPAAIGHFRAAEAAVKRVLEQRHIAAEALSTGPTPALANVQALAGPDELRIKLAVIAVVAAVVFLLIRDALLTAVLLLITLLAYQATMGLTALLFVKILGHDALNWQVKMFSFVVLMAVGQDYNLFLVSRLGEERTRRHLRPAVRHALVRTGAIISSCGLITAVSLGALCVSGLSFFAQMGFALACGTLLDTFLIRPVLLPAILVVMGRPKRVSHRWGTDSHG